MESSSVQIIPLCEDWTLGSSAMAGMVSWTGVWLRLHSKRFSKEAASSRFSIPGSGMLSARSSSCGDKLQIALFSPLIPRAPELTRLSLEITPLPPPWPKDAGTLRPVQVLFSSCWFCVCHSFATLVCVLLCDDPACTSQCTFLTSRL